MSTVLQIDGSQGEGGGQILRSSLALSAALGRPFRISRIRAGREKPGLLRQHLTCVAAVQAVCSAEVLGADVGSRDLEFRPGPVRAGDYSFAIGTAGSTSLVLQAVLPPLLTANGPSRVTVEGGTHARGAPPFEFLERSLVPLLNRMGPRIEVRLDRHGFYPAGGGRVIAEIQPSSRLAPLELHRRGEVLGTSATILLSQLAFAIAERELAMVRDHLGWEISPSCVVHPRSRCGPGNALLLELRCESHTELFTGLGELGKSAEHVAHEAVQAVKAYLGSGAPIGPYLADQLMVPLALAGSGSFVTGPLTPHALTNASVIAAFRGRPIAIEGKEQVCCRF